MNIHTLLFVLSYSVSAQCAFEKLTNLLVKNRVRDIFMDQPKARPFGRRFFRTLPWPISLNHVRSHIKEGLVVSTSETGPQIDPSAGTNKPLILMIRQQNQPCPRLDQKIYYYESLNHSLTEEYCLNGTKYRSHLDPDWIDLSFSLLRRSDLRGMKFKVLIEVQEPYVTFEKPSIGHFQTPSGTWVVPISSKDIKGLFIDLMSVLSRELNFQIEWIAPVERNFGVPFPNGTATGMVRTLIAREMDMSVAPFTATLSRFDVMDYLIPLGYETRVIIIKRTTTEDINWSLLGSPFHRNLWLMLGIKAVVFMGLMIIMLILYQRSNLTLKEVLIQSIENAFNYLGSILGKKVFHIQMEQHVAARIMIFFLFMEGNIIFMAYKASLTSELSVKSYALPFDDLPSLLKSDYKLIMGRGGGLLLHSFETAQESSILGQIYAKNLNRGDGTIFNDAQTAGEYLINNNGLAIITMLEENTLHSCEITVAWQTQYPDWVSIVLPKNSPLTDLFNFKLLQMKEQGINRLLEQKWSQKQLDCSEDPFSGLGVEKMIALFSFLLTGFIIAILIFIFECGTNF